VPCTDTSSLARTRRCSTFASNSSGMSDASEISRALDELVSVRVARCFIEMSA
jgi:hypothetical protein